MTDARNKRKTKLRRGRPGLSEDELSDRRAEIAAVALRLFKQEGFASVSMRRLGKEVGLTPMALYRYFPTKLEILSTLWGYILGEAFKEVRTAIRQTQEPDQKLRSACHSYVDYWFCNVEHYQLVFMNSGVTNNQVTSFVSQDSVIDAYEVFFENTAKALRLPRSHKDVKTSTDGLICHLHGIMHSLITMQGYNWTARERLIETAVDKAIAN